MLVKSNSYDVVVVGAGHAGIEAALAAARCGASTLMLTMNLDSVGQMSCNPAVGGIGKGHLVREIDALGGEMGRAIDACGIQFRRLNTRKGPAVQASRAQADKARYRMRMKRIVESTDGLTLRQAQIVSLDVVDGCVVGVVTEHGESIGAATVVLTTGTFLQGRMHVGSKQSTGGRAGDRASQGLSAALADLGLELGRLKTGTCPRLDGRSIDYSRLQEQPGDEAPSGFSFDGGGPVLPQVSCWITYTNPTTHRIIADSIDQSPMYSGEISSRGPRYCPSVEDKVVKFPQRDRHRIFLEPEGLDTVEVYPNGLSTALPLAVQQAFVASIEGLEDAVIVRPGYAIEYDYVMPTQLQAWLETRSVANLFLAGQINGTTGYEEAAAQGFVAGVSAARRVRGQEPLVLGREEAYIGVLIDDLVTQGVDGEPYRMFTSRAEFRLLLREDNADLRLAERAHEIGLLSPERQQRVSDKIVDMETGRRALHDTQVVPDAATNAALAAMDERPMMSPSSAFDLLRRPTLTYDALCSLAALPRLDAECERQLTIEAGYDGYIRRQRRDLDRMRGLEEARLPADMKYESVRGLSVEAQEKLNKARPTSLGQAARITGVTPAALGALAVHMKKTARA